MNEISVQEARVRLEELLDAAFRGGTVLIANDAAHVVRLVPVSRAQGHRQFGSASGLITIREDFEAPLEWSIPTPSCGS